MMSGMRNSTKSLNLTKMERLLKLTKICWCHSLRKGKALSTLIYHKKLMKLSLKSKIIISGRSSVTLLLVAQTTLKLTRLRLSLTL